MDTIERRFDPDIAYQPDLAYQDVSRWAALVGAGAVTLYGLSRRDRAGAIIALVGGAMLIGAARGSSWIDDWLGIESFDGAGGEANVLRGRAVRVAHSVVVDRPVDVVYHYWRDLENLPRFMRHLVSVEALPSGRYRWVAKAPVGTVEWDAEILEEQVPWLISWRSLPGSRIDNAGSVRFSPNASGIGTEVRVELAYKPPAGSLGAVAARLMGEEPHVQVREDLERFREILETG